MAQKVFIFSKKHSTRLEYVCKVLFQELCKIDFEILIYSNLENIQIYENQSVIFYGLEKSFSKSHLNIYSDGQLFSTQKTFQSIDFELNDSFENYDPFSFSFYLLTEIYNYSNSSIDIYQRANFPALVPKNFDWEVPFLHVLAKSILEKIDLNFEKPKFNEKLTIDIDHPFYLHGISWGKKIKRILKILFNQNFNSFFDIKKDVFYTYDWIIDHFEKPQFFFLLSQNTKFDSSISPNYKPYQTIIKYIAKKTSIGIHPSFDSSENLDLIKNEINLLENIANQKVIHSRQHFLKYQFKTLNFLNQQGIEKEWSSCFWDKLGFKNGIAITFSFYDLENEQITQLKREPAIAMDRTFLSYLNSNPALAKAKINELKEKVKIYGGNFNLITHNETFSNFGEWKNWKEVF